jgi:hypothetical protein
MSMIVTPLSLLFPIAQHLAGIAVWTSPDVFPPQARNDKKRRAI